MERWNVQNKEVATKSSCLLVIEVCVFLDERKSGFIGFKYIDTPKKTSIAVAPEK